MSEIWSLNGDSTILPNSRLIVLDGGTAYYWGGQVNILFWLEVMTIVVEAAIFMMFRDWMVKHPAKTLAVVIVANLVTALVGYGVFLLA